METQPKYSFLRDGSFLPWLIGFIAGVAYFVTRSPALDEWDSVQFAMGVLRFNLAEHRPHPPGYPLYVFAGWMLNHGVGLKVETALLAVSSVGGGLLAGAWFALLRNIFGAMTAAVAAAALFFMPGVWMASTIVMTDAPAAGMLAVALLAAQRFRSAPSMRTLVMLALACAAESGIRPQNIGIVLIIYIFALATTANDRSRWAKGAGLFVAFNLLWFLPLLWTQARVAPGGFDFFAWPELVWKQWRWRLDKPQVFVGASGLGIGALLKRMNEHFGGWISYGFGFRTTTGEGIAGLVLLGGGILAYVSTRPWLRAQERSFWSGSALWSLPYIAMIFITLPGDQRYYLPVYPLLVAAMAAGLVAFAQRFRAPAWVAFLCVLPIAKGCLPYAIEHHREEAPPVRIVRRTVKEIATLPAGQHTVAIFSSSYRHAQWYAPELEAHPGYELLQDRITASDSDVVYTDDHDVIEKLKSEGWIATKVKEYKRRKIIYRKHANVELWRLEKQGGKGISTE
ncbi:hypothetical protein BH09SUM1_BH09SUM1_15930 [soil metagenome]